MSFLARLRRDIVRHDLPSKSQVLYARTGVQSIPVGPDIGFINTAHFSMAGDVDSSNDGDSS
jgi:hypothetical protein